MISARVMFALGVVSAYVEYTMERAGPEPYVIHCSQALVAVVHGAAGAVARCVGPPIDEDNSAVAASRKVVFMGESVGGDVQAGA